MHRVIAILVTLVVSAGLSVGMASAKSCGEWTATMQELEEGRALVASVCSSDDGGLSYLEARCFPPGLNIRYVPRDEADYNDFKGDLTFETSENQRPVFVTYEGLDGAFAAYLPFGHPAIEMMKSGKSITIGTEGGGVPVRSFELGGSRQALEKLEKSCQN